MPFGGTSPRMVPTLPGPAGIAAPTKVGGRIEDDGGKAPFPLVVAPPDTTGYTVRTITQAEADLDSDSNLVLALDDATDYVIDAPYRINRTVRLQGGRNIVWIGGHIRINHKGYFANPQTRRGMYIADGVSAVDRIIHIEGLWIDGSDLGDGIALFAPKANLRLGYFRCERDYQRNSDSFGTRSAPFTGTEMYQGQEGGHSDNFQNFGGHRGLLIERATANASVTGFRFDEGQGLIGNDNRLRHVNIRATSNVTTEEAPYTDVAGPAVGGTAKDNFEVDINGWTALNACTISLNTTTPMTGVGSMNVVRGTNGVTTLTGAVFQMGAPGEDWRNPDMAISAEVRLNSGGDPHPMARIDVSDDGNATISGLPGWHFGQERKLVQGQNIRLIGHYPAQILQALRKVRICVLTDANEDAIDFDVDTFRFITGEIRNVFTGPPLRYEGSWGLYHNAAGDVLCDDVWIKNLVGGNKIDTGSLRNYDIRGVDYTVTEAAPTLQAEGTIDAVTTGAPAPTIPTHQADDILIVDTVAWAPATTGYAEEIPTPAGWEKVASDFDFPVAGVADGRRTMFWKRATGAGETITLTRPANWDTGTDTCYGARAYVIRGVPATAGPPFAPVAAGQPWDPYVSPNGGACMDLAGPHTGANGALAPINVVDHSATVIHFGAMTDNAVLLSAASGYTIGTAATSITGTDCGFQTARKENINAPQPSVATTTTAPAQGFYSFIGIAFKGASRYYYDLPPGTQTIEDFVRPKPNGSGSDGNGSYITSAPYLDFTGAAPARLYQGDPPIGDMCPPGIAGINYVPPDTYEMLLDLSAGQSGGSLAITIPAGEVEIPLESAVAVSTGTLELTAGTQVPLSASAAVSSATLALGTATTTPLGTSAAQSSATLALTAATRVPLDAAAAQSSATLALKAQTTVPLGSSVTQASATLALRATTAIPFQTSVGTSSATLALTAQTRVSLNASAAQSSATLAVTVPAGVEVPLATAAAQSAAALAVRVSTQVPLATAGATLNATVVLRAATQIPLVPVVALSSGSLVVLGGALPPVPETHPELGGVVVEPLRGGIFDELASGGVVAALLRGGVFDELNRGADPGVSRSADPDEPSRNGTHDESLTGGEVF